MTRDRDDFSSAETEAEGVLGATAPSELDTLGEIDEMLEELDTAIEAASAKVESGRVYDSDNEQTRIQWIRALGYLMRTKRQILDDRDRAAMIREIREIEELSERERHR